jgi:hypothetical protein
MHAAFVFPHLQKIAGRRPIRIPAAALAFIPLTASLKGSPEALDTSSLPEYVYIKFVSTSFGRKKVTSLPFASGNSNLQYNDLLVSIHFSFGHIDGERQIVSLRGQAFGSPTASPSTTFIVGDQLRAPFADVKDCRGRCLHVLCARINSKCCNSDVHHGKYAACRFVSVRAGRVFEVLRFLSVRARIRLHVMRFVSCVSEF